MIHKIVDELSVQNSVDIFNLEENEILEILLGAVNSTIKELDTDTWSWMMYYNSKTYTCTPCITYFNMSYLKTGSILSFEETLHCVVSDVYKPLNIFLSVLFAIL